jgi:hypothetical protein
MSASKQSRVRASNAARPKPKRPRAALLSQVLVDRNNRKSTISFSSPRQYRGDWLCVVTFRGLDLRPERVFGVHPIQAITLAIERVGRLVQRRSLRVLETGLPARTAFPPAFPTWPGVAFITRVKKLVDLEEARFVRGRQGTRRKKAGFVSLNRR